MLCNFIQIGFAKVSQATLREIDIKALKNFSSMLDDGNCTNIVFVENVSHQESSDAVKSMFLDFVSDNTHANYFTHISIRYW